MGYWTTRPLIRRRFRHWFDGSPKQPAREETPLCRGGFCCLRCREFDDRASELSRSRSGAAGNCHPRPLWRPVRADRWLLCRLLGQHGLLPTYVWLLLELVAGHRIGGGGGGP